MDKYIIILGGDAIRAEAYEVAHQIGLKVILMKNSISRDDIYAVDYPVEIDLKDNNLVLEKTKRLAETLDVTGVASLIEYYTPLASLLASALKVGGFATLQSVATCRNKALFRKALKGSNIPVPLFTEVGLNQSFDRSVMEPFSYPVIIKPANCSSSSHVYQCNSFNDAKRRIEEIKEARNNLVGEEISSILIEEFLVGDEVSVESFTYNGETNIITIVDKYKSEPPYFAELGHSTPSRHAHETQENIGCAVREAIKAIGLNNSVSHTEVMITKSGPVIVEMAARPAGGYIRDMVKLSCGVDIYKIALSLAAGCFNQRDHKFDEKRISAALRFITADRGGVYQRIINSAPADYGSYIKRLHVSVEEGAAVSPPKSNIERYGHVLIQGKTDNDASKIADAIIGNIKMECN